MPLKDQYQHIKDAWKRRLGMSSASSVAQSSGSSSPAPQTQTPSTATSTVNVQIPVSPGSAPLNALVDRWPGLKTLLEVVGSSTDIFPPLRSAMGGLSACVELFENASKGRKEYVELLARLDSLLGDLSGHIANAFESRFTASMMNLCIGLEQELKVVEEKSTRGQVRRHLEAGNDSDDLMESYRRIQGYLERLSMNANISMWNTVNRLETEARLSALTPAMAAVYNSAESEVVQRRLCTPGTREQVLVRLLDWARNKPSDAQDIYWMNGMAGTGKTTIAYSLCAELETSAELGASFFCSRLIPECRNVKSIFPSIAYQLARFSRPFCCALSTILESEPDVHTRVLRMQFETLLVKPLTEVKQTLPTDFVIVIDALDECENEDSVGQMLDVLLSYTTGSELPARFLISSRPELEIYHRMMARVGNSLGARLVLHDLDAQIVKHDIELYLRAELTSVDITSSQLSGLVELSGMLFIFASTAARYINDGLQYMEHEDRLNTILGLAPESTDSKDKEIDKLYASILGAVFKSKTISKSIQTRLKTVLDTIICAQEPMSVDGLAGLLQMKSGKQVDALLRPLSSVLNISESSRIVTTLHASFPDYMLDQERSSLFCCDSSKTHSRVLKQCFEVIKLQDPQFNICGLESSYVHDDRIPDLVDRANKAVSSHLFYSCRYWLAHLERGDSLDNLGMCLWEFLSTQLLLWMEVLNVKRCMSLGPKITQLAEAWSRARQCPQETIDLAHDAWRFVSTFTGNPVSHSTPHIYISMIPFWPEYSPISKSYSSRLQGLIQPRGTGMERRQLALLTTWPYRAYPCSMGFSPDGSLIAFEAPSGPCILDGLTGQTVLGPLVCKSNPCSVAFSPDGKLLVSGYKDKKIRVWRSKDGKLIIDPFMGHTASVNSVSFFPDGSRIVSGSDDKTVRVWDLRNGATLTRTIEAHDDSVNSVRISPDSSRICSGSNDKTVRVWDVDSGVLAFSPLRGHTDFVLSVRFSPDGTQIVSGSYDSTVRVWDALTGQPLNLLEGHLHGVYCADFSRDGNYIASGSRDLTIRLWDIRGSKSSVGVLRGHINDVFSLAFSPDSTRIVSGSADWTIRSWDVISLGSKHYPSEGHTQRFSHHSPSHSDFRVVSCSSRETIHVWDWKTGELVLGPLCGHTDIINSALFSPDRRQIVSCSWDKTIKLWDAQTGLLIGETFTGPTDRIICVCFSPSGELLAAGSRDGTVWFWDIHSPNPIAGPLREHKRWVQTVCFSVDGRAVISGSSDKTILIWDVELAQPLFPPLQGHQGIVWQVCTSPDGTRIASCSEDTTIRLWHAHTGQTVANPLQGHTGPVTSVYFSPDGQYIVSGSADRSIRLWNAHTGQSVGSVFTMFTRPAGCYFFDDKRIISQSQDKSIRVWDVGALLEPPGSNS